ncbi:hypothetical protein AVEN_152933-1 [Araneus ventricosus]|uniref:Uncharacterized protein n=1 Tax=Araneus ventricosus TaxID=182803 RepID=A0A4Y2AFI9_ARAVE|nr:hypothetical protein AVEN_152933-1 [Araneus ventricosus]
MKTLVYETPVDSVEDIVARISVAAGEGGIFQNVRKSMKRRCEDCIQRLKSTVNLIKFDNWIFSQSFKSNPIDPEYEYVPFVQQSISGMKCLSGN